MTSATSTSANQVLMMNEEIDIFRVLDYMRDHAAAYAKAKAERQYLENFRKTVKAQQMKHHLDMPVSAQEREAYASDAIQDVDRAIKIATEEEARLYWLLSAAQVKADVWRSLQASQRIEARHV
jgi:hypothetical protein